MLLCVQTTKGKEMDMKLSYNETRILFYLYKNKCMNPIAGTSVLDLSDSFSSSNTQLTIQTARRNLKSLISKGLVSEGARLNNGGKSYYILESGIELMQDAMNCKIEQQKQN